MNLEALKTLRLSPVEQSYGEKDLILYALALGYGEQPSNLAQLHYVYELGLKAAPSICVVLAHPGFWVNLPGLEINWLKILHGEHSFEILRPLPVIGKVRGEYEIIGVEDKGVEKGAVMHVAKKLFNVANNDLLATVTSVYMLRGDGGQGGFGEVFPTSQPIPDCAPDLSLEIRTSPRSALLYRLTGDLNPIHADPSAARKAGFERPILHGLCSLGIVSRALIDTVAEGEPERLRSVSVRFSQPVFPGDTICTEIFKVAEGFRFRARAVERDVIVLDRGTVKLAS